jgi:8-hydroxy-5-deazaflavin:NADPH oxidoreductase
VEKDDNALPVSTRIAVVGGTGPQGRGLAYRFAAAGHHVVLGSRDPGRAQQAAAELNAALPAHMAGNASGDANEAAIAQGDVAVIAVPWNGHEALVTSLPDKVVISCVNPLAFDARGPVGSRPRRVRRRAGPAADTHCPCGWCLPPTSRPHRCGTRSEPLAHEDVLVCADDAEAKQFVQKLATSVTGKLGIDAGALRLSRQLEPLTAVLISVNKQYRTRSRIAVTGIAKEAGRD